MLRRLSTVPGYTIQAVDGELGKVHDFFLEDQTWMVRYPVVQAGAWLDQRRVLLSEALLGKPGWQARTFPCRWRRSRFATARTLMPTDQCRGSRKSR